MLNYLKKNHQRHQIRPLFLRKSKLAKKSVSFWNLLLKKTIITKLFATPSLLLTLKSTEKVWNFCHISNWSIGKTHSQLLFCLCKSKDMSKDSSKLTGVSEKHIDMTLTGTAAGNLQLASAYWVIWKWRAEDKDLGGQLHQCPFFNDHYHTSREKGRFLHLNQASWLVWVSAHWQPTVGNQKERWKRHQTVVIRTTQEKGVEEDTTAKHLARSYCLWFLGVRLVFALISLLMNKCGVYCPGGTGVHV